MARERETSIPEGPRTYQTAWPVQGETAEWPCVTAESWLEREADVHAAMEEDEERDGPSTAGTLRAIAGEIRRLRRDVHLWSEQATRLTTERETLAKESAEWEQRARKTLWLRHGCDVMALYGDDGEMQCNRCMADFKREEWSALEMRLFRAALARQSASSLAAGDAGADERREETHG